MSSRTNDRKLGTDSPFFEAIAVCDWGLYRFHHLGVCDGSRDTLPSLFKIAVGGSGCGRVLFALTAHRGALRTRPRAYKARRIHRV